MTTSRIPPRTESGEAERQRLVGCRGIAVALTICIPFWVLIVVMIYLGLR